MADRQGVEVAAQGALKRFRINAAHLQAHGYTDGCPQCGHIQRVSDEQSPAYGSQANGGVEVGVMLIRGLFRTLGLGLEASIGKKSRVDHAIMPWLLEHTALLLSVRSRLPSGLTPWATIRGRPFGQKIIGFGEVVLWKLPTKGPASQPEGNMGAQ